MNNNRIMLKLMIVIASLIIFISSLEVLMLSKSVEAFHVFTKMTGSSDFSVFINYTLQNYFMTIIEPVVITLYTYFTFNRIRINKYYHIFFGSIVLIRIILLVIMFNYHSIIYYIIITLYVVYFVNVITIRNYKGDKNGISQRT